MRIQASLEFLLILSAISIVALGVISFYGHQMSYEKHLANLSLNIDNYSTKESEYGLGFSFSAYAPYKVELGGVYLLSFVATCQNGSIKVSFESSSAKVSQNQSSYNISGIVAGYVYFIPEESGFEKIELHYNASCGKNYSGNYNITTYAFSPIQYSNYSQNYFAIYNRTEYIIYNKSSSNNIFYLKYWGHCQYQFPNTSVAVECRTKNAWDYDTLNYYCYTNDLGLYYTTCIYPAESEYNISNIQYDQYNFSYYFNAQAYYYGRQIYFSFNNTKCTYVYSEGNAIGRACIYNITGIGPLNGLSLIYNKSKEGIANQSLYQSYIQAKNNMESVLSYFNSSYVDGSEISQIYSAIDYYTKESSALEKEGFENISSCIIDNSKLACKPIYPLSYIILANLSIRVPATTLYYEGSILKIS